MLSRVKMWHRTADMGQISKTQLYRRLYMYVLAKKQKEMDLQVNEIC